MHSLFAGIHLNKSNEFLPLENIDFGKTVQYLKEEIGHRLHFDANNIEIIYQGNTLEDDLQLEGLLRPNATVHCFRKTKKYPEYKPIPTITEENAISRIQELFNVIAHIQISVNSRVNILQKILAEYPEFRRNLGAQALIRDSVLFNTLHQPEVIKNIAEHYPLICEAAPFIVDTIKKELTRSTSTSNFSEPTTDSTNSSEDDSNSNERSVPDSTSPATENARIRMISRQQLQAALANIGAGSVNSLSNIAQQQQTTTTSTSNTNLPARGTVPPPTQLSTEERNITTDHLRNELRRALDSFNQRSSSTSNPSTSTATATATAQSDAPMLEERDDGDGSSTSDDVIPAYYRSHQYVEQLRTMAQMGFVNYQVNLTYLHLTDGNIENAINLLMGAMN